jgi:hypothetical protein
MLWACLHKENATEHEGISFDDYCYTGSRQSINNVRHLFWLIRLIQCSANVAISRAWNGSSILHRIVAIQNLNCVAFACSIASQFDFLALKPRACPALAFNARMLQSTMQGLDYKPHAAGSGLGLYTLMWDGDRVRFLSERRLRRLELK